MTETRPGANLVPLTDTDRTIADPEADVRERDVIDRDGEKIGRVEDILVDDEEMRARFLRVASGGFLGIGKERFLVPVDVITGIEDDLVHIDRERARLTDVPAYDPELVYAPDYYEDVYTWWGAAPFWAPGYVYPTTPFRRP